MSDYVSQAVSEFLPASILIDLWAQFTDGEMESSPFSRCLLMRAGDTGYVI